MFTPDNPGFDVPQVPETPRPTPRIGPCGEIPQAPKTKYRPKELLIRLRDGAVTCRGYSKEALALFQMLWNDHAVRIESLRTVWAFAKSIRAGEKGAPWQVAFESQPAVPAQPLGMGIPHPHWETKLGDAGWIGATLNDGIIAPTGQYVYTLAIGELYGGEGAFSLAWAADNDAVWSITNGGSLRGVRRGENAFSPVKGDAPSDPRPTIPISKRKCATSMSTSARIPARNCSVACGSLLPFYLRSECH